MILVTLNVQAKNSFGDDWPGSYKKKKPEHLESFCKPAERNYKYLYTLLLYEA